MQYIAMKASAVSSSNLREDRGTVQVDTDLRTLLVRMAKSTGSLVVVWTYTGNDGLMDAGRATDWAEMIRPSYMYVLADGGQFIQLPPGLELADEE